MHEGVQMLIVKQKSYAVREFLFNIKHGMITLQVPRQADHIIKQDNPDLPPDRLESLLPKPASVSDVLAAEWSSQYSISGYRKFYKKFDGSSQNLVEEWEEQIEYIILPRIQLPHETLAVVMAALGLQHGDVLPQSQNAKEITQALTRPHSFYQLILGTSPSQWAAELLYRHRPDFGHKIFASVKVFSLEPAHLTQYPSLIWKVVPYSDCLVQEGLARS